ncbi:uncharacterized protein LOC131802162 [Musca domestica]|uniref:Regulatory protein zeste n=1 Tax=Musca domestica TaxID=7370 RepID=A0ABM3UVX6_MUSDO|nr:uncharacterized protein LOC131802162 [Musca domestica]
MGANPNLARGIRVFGETKATANEAWEKISDNLNSHGPPTRAPEEWQRVWIQFKAKLKKKMSQNKRNLNATGGGPSQEVRLSPLCSTAADLLQINLVTDPAGAIYGIMETWDEDGIEIVSNVKVEQEEAATQMENVRPTPRRTVRREYSKISILREQTSTQNELLLTIAKLEKEAKEQNEILKANNNLLKERNELQIPTDLNYLSSFVE